jgi:hypothetical protein
MAALRYLLFAAVGVVVASALFLVLSFLVSVNREASVGFFERWIVKYTCDQYELKGTVRDPQGRPVPYAVVEASFLDERLTTRSNVDGTFMLMADESVCNRRLPRTVQLVVLADDFRPKSTTLSYDEGSVEVTLDARDFRP